MFVYMNILKYMTLNLLRVSSICLCEFVTVQDKVIDLRYLGRGVEIHVNVTIHGCFRYS